MSTRRKVWWSVSIIIAAALAFAIVVGSALQNREQSRLVEALSRAAAAPVDGGTVTPGSLSGLPQPVARYLRHVLQAKQAMIQVARFREIGSLRTDTNSTRWYAFEARQIVTPQVTGFTWSADVRLAPLVHLGVYDALLDGRGSSRVALLAAFTIARAGGNLEMNSGALHRYLAEAVWYPTALLPSANLQWKAMNEHKALATLTANGVTVSLEFWFNERDEIVGIYTPARWGSFNGGYQQVAWEGHFRDYRARGGLLVPAEEVGWYSHGQWMSVWHGTVTDASYAFAHSL